MDARIRRTTLALALPAFLFLGSCKAAYYATMGRFGTDKREIFAERVETGKREQAGAREQFESTFDLFQRITANQSGDLEELYGRMKRELDHCEDSAADFRDQVDSIQDVAADFFEDWESELPEIADEGLRRKSASLLGTTRKRYETLMASMTRVQARMTPVLSAFQDHVVFFKHNLNARGIATLQDSVAQVRVQLDGLFEEMRGSIAEADAFLVELAGSAPKTPAP
jgi:hypothetical protein